MIKLIEDISVLSGVSEKTLKNFIPLSNYCIGHALFEAQCVQQNTVELDLGIGKLLIKIERDALRYRFVPSKELEKTLIQTLTTKSSPIITKIDNKLQDKIECAYKELL